MFKTQKHWTLKCAEKATSSISNLDKAEPCNFQSNLTFKSHNFDMNIFQEQGLQM